jgi:hypothetical protein
MELIIPSSTDAGPPPPPPPIYAEKTRGSKSVAGTTLHLVCRGLVEVTKLSVLHGATLWMRGPSSQWYKGSIPWGCFDGSGILELEVDTTLDPTDVRIQPHLRDWAQGVVLDHEYVVLPLPIATPA